MPYRVGLWISKADLGGGEKSAEEESKALAHLINITAGNFCQSAFVMELMEKTLDDKRDKTSWTHDPEEVASDARKSVELLERVAHPEDILNYKTAIMEVALAVARAYNESIDDLSLGEKLNAFGRIWIDRAVRKLRGEENMESAAEDINISNDEQKALEKLADALKVDIGEMSGMYQHMGGE